VVSQNLLLFDGTCGFCAASVQFILRHERRGTLRFAPLQGRTADEVLRRHPELLGVDSMVWVEGLGGPSETVRVRSGAVLQVASYLGRFWQVAQLGRLLPSRLADAVYDLVARHRHRIFQEPESCYLPPPEVRERFLD